MRAPSTQEEIRQQLARVCATHFPLCGCDVCKRHQMSEWAREQRRQAKIRAQLAKLVAAGLIS